MLYDVFICHASEDKEAFVRPLAEALRAEHVEVWYDDFSLKLGDSIRRSIHKGLKQSCYGIVVLSRAFFAKEWPQYELDGLADREMSGRERLILPVWHGVDHAAVSDYSPSLAGRRAISSADIRRVVREVSEIVHPTGSPLLAARDQVIAMGAEPPVVTDARWLRAVEASMRIPGFGMTVPPYSEWEGWSFPLPPPSDDADEWGDRLAWAYLQLDWTEAADRETITVISPPEVVHQFLERFPGLLELSSEYIDLLIEYAPQLSIRGFEGPLEAEIDRAYQRSRRKAAGWIQPKRSCQEEWALRHPKLGGHHRSTVAHAYFSGGMFGPSVSPFEHYDHMFWLLSDVSLWLPPRIRELLRLGMAEYGTWRWDVITPDPRLWPEAGQLAAAVKAAETGRKRLRWTDEMQIDLRNRIAGSKKLMNLPEPVEVLAQRFMDLEAPELYIRHWRELLRKPKRGG